MGSFFDKADSCEIKAKEVQAIRCRNLQRGIVFPGFLRYNSVKNAVSPMNTGFVN